MQGPGGLDVCNLNREERVCFHMLYIYYEPKYSLVLLLGVYQLIFARKENDKLKKCTGMFHLFGIPNPRCIRVDNLTYNLKMNSFTSSSESNLRKCNRKRKGSISREEL